MLRAENVLVIYASDGRILVCGPECYDALLPLCCCCCEGRHHGMGFEVAKALAADHVLAANARGMILSHPPGNLLMVEAENFEMYARSPAGA
jgi:hypothetical protein